MIGSLFLINGINCSKVEFLDNFLSVTDKIPEGTLCIGIYNPTEGIKSDIKRAQTMIKTHQDTPRIVGVRQMLSTLLTTTHKINPELLTVLLPHSEGGEITTCPIPNDLSMEVMSLEDIRLLPKPALLGKIGNFSE